MISTLHNYKQTTRWDTWVQNKFNWSEVKAICVPLSKKKNLKSSMLNEHICAHPGVQYNHTGGFFFFIKVTCLSWLLRLLCDWTHMCNLPKEVRKQPPHAGRVTSSVCQRHQVCRSALSDHGPPKQTLEHLTESQSVIADGLIRVQIQGQRPPWCTDPWKSSALHQSCN